MYPMRSVSVRRENAGRETTDLEAPDLEAKARTRDGETDHVFSATMLVPGWRVQERIAFHAQRQPDEIALVQGPVRLTYDQINARANRLARYFVSLGLRPAAPVGLCMRNGLVSMIACLAVLKAGGACVPLDPIMGPHWLAAFIIQAGIDVAIVDDHHALDLFEDAPRLNLLDYESISAAAELESDADFDIAWDTDSLALILPVSQVAGPRGVEMTHRALHHCCDLAHGLDFSAATVALQMVFAPQELAWFQNLSLLIAGGRLVFYGAIWPETAEIANLIRSETIDTSFLTPSLCGWLLDEDPSLFAPLERVVIGEQDLAPVPLAPIHLRILLRQLVKRGVKGATKGEIVLLYGPAEAPAALMTRLWHEDDADDVTRIVPEPLNNARVQLLDTRRRPCPDGVLGEICLGGEGLASGYRRDERLSQQSFIPDPAQPEDKLFRTGDYARRRLDGTFERLGRLDEKVILSGYRVELKAIERVLRAQKGVADAVCDYRRSRAYGESVIAFFVEASPGAINETRLRRQ